MTGETKVHAKTRYTPVATVSLQRIKFAEDNGHNLKAEKMLQIYSNVTPNILLDWRQNGTEFEGKAAEWLQK